MSGGERKAQDPGAFEIDIDADLLEAAVGAVERIERQRNGGAASAGRPAEAREGSAEDEEEASPELPDLPEDFEIDFDVSGLEELDGLAADDFEASAEATNAVISQQQVEVQALSERLADVQDELDEVRQDRDRLANRSAGFLKERRRQQGHIRMLEERLTRVEQHRQKLLDERDGALQRIAVLEKDQQALVDDLAVQRERVRNEQSERRRTGAGPVLLEILPAIDNLELALAHADADPDRVVQGLIMILQQLHLGLQRVGVDRVDAEPGAAFDPEWHEAIMEEPAGEHPPGHITRVLSAGYRFSGRLLRPAKVAVGTAEAAEAAGLAETTGTPPDDAPSEEPPADDETLPAGHAPAASDPGDEGEDEDEVTLRAPPEAAPAGAPAPDDEPPGSAHEAERADAHDEEPPESW